MNQTVSLKFQTMDDFLYSVGSTWLLDSFFLFVSVPTSLSGFIMNTISMIILMKKEYKVNLYKYLRFYTLLGLAINLVSIFLIVTTTRRYFAFNNTLAAFTYRAYFCMSAMNTGYFIGSLVEIFISFDRLSTLSNHFLIKLYKRLNPYLVCFFVCIFVLLINCSYYFVFMPVKRVALILNYYEGAANQSKIVELYTFTASDYSKTTLGRSMSYIQFAIRDIFTLIVDILVNIVTVRLLKKHLLKKSNLTRVSSSESTANRSVRIMSQDVSTLKTDFKSQQVELSKMEGSISEHDKSHQSRSVSVVAKKSTNAEQKITMMVLSMVSLSIYSHIMQIIFITYSYYNTNFYVSLIFAFSSYSITLKNAANFPLFYCFNNNFKKSFREMFGLNKK